MLMDRNHRAIGTSFSSSFSQPHPPSFIPPSILPKPIFYTILLFHHIPFSIHSTCWSRHLITVVTMMRKSAAASRPLNALLRFLARISFNLPPSTGGSNKNKEGEMFKVRRAKILRMEQEQMLEDNIVMKIIQVREAAFACTPK